MPLFPNVLITTARSTYSPSTGITSAPATYLQGVQGHIMPTPAKEYHVLPESALTSPFVIKIDSGTDIRDKDIVTSLVLLTDGETPWPNMNLANATNETWRVTYAQESTPGPLAYRAIYIDRVRGGGTTY